MDNTKCKVCKKQTKPLVADLWEGYIHEQGFMRPHLCLRHDLHPKQVGEGVMFYLLATNKHALSTLTRRQRREQNIAVALLLSLLSYFVRNVNELFESQEAKQTTEFGVGVEDTCSIRYQPCMSDEADLY